MANKTRPKKITFRLSEEELQLFNDKVTESGMNQQEYCVSAVLGAEIVNNKIEGLKEILPELKRQGNNLNQIAKAYHETGKIDDCAHVQRWVSALNQMYVTLGELSKKNK